MDYKKSDEPVSSYIRQKTLFANLIVDNTYIAPCSCAGVKQEIIEVRLLHCSP